MKLQFITAIPLNVERGSGCFVGIQTLARGIQSLGNEVEMTTPRVHAPVFTLERILFNEQLRRRRFRADAIVGFDLDGYALTAANGGPRIAAIKGVLGDAVRFERGFTRASMALQAHLEKLHARRADLVITISRYCRDRLRELYGVGNALVVPELIDLTAWRRLFAENPAPVRRREFTVLCVCRFYPRKRVDVLLRALRALQEQIPDFQVRIVGGGPEARVLRELSRSLGVENNVAWVGDVTQEQLAREYNGADVFCLPSVQEGFGIVFLEAMAAGKPIVAANAAAVPEVVQHGLLTEPGNPEALAGAIKRLYDDSDLRRQLAEEGKRDVEKYEMRRVAQMFLEAVE